MDTWLLEVVHACLFHYLDCNQAKGLDQLVLQGYSRGKLLKTEKGIRAYEQVCRVCKQVSLLILAVVNYKYIGCPDQEYASVRARLEIFQGTLLGYKTVYNQIHVCTQGFVCVEGHVCLHP